MLNRWGWGRYAFLLPCPPCTLALTRLLSGPGPNYLYWCRTCCPYLFRSKWHHHFFVNIYMYIGVVWIEWHCFLLWHWPHGNNILKSKCLDGCHLSCLPLVYQSPVMFSLLYPNLDRRENEDSMGAIHETLYTKASFISQKTLVHTLEKVKYVHKPHRNLELKGYLPCSIGLTGSLQP